MRKFAIGERVRDTLTRKTGEVVAHSDLQSQNAYLVLLDGSQLGPKYGASFRLERELEEIL